MASIGQRSFANTSVAAQGRTTLFRWITEDAGPGSVHVTRRLEAAAMEAAKRPPREPSKAVATIPPMPTPATVGTVVGEPLIDVMGKLRVTIARVEKVSRVCGDG